MFVWCSGKSHISPPKKGDGLMSCRDGRCEFDSRMTRDAPVSVEQRIAAELWLKEYIERLRRERPELLERVLREEKRR